MDGNDSTAETGMRAREGVVLAADVVGFTRLMASDQIAAFAELGEIRKLLGRHVEAHGGRVANLIGDAFISLFDLEAAAVLAADAIQTELAARNAARAENVRMLLRIGIHAGGLLEQLDGTIYGTAVNIAARLETLAPAGGIALSGLIETRTRGRLSLRLLDQGDYDIKHAPEPMRVFLVDGSGADALAASPKAVPSLLRGNLPSVSSHLHGRDAALRELGAQLQENRLVTLFGTGGLGKTRLAIETARRVAPDYPDGVWFADLAAISEPDHLLPSVASVLGVTQTAGVELIQAVIEALRSQRLLLILDNCEHITAAAAELAAALLAGCPRLGLLATSREALAIDGEHVWPLDPLDITGRAEPAVAMFAERARMAGSPYEPAEFEDDIIGICRTLDGIPLAIELAAARSRSLSPRQIRDRLGQRFQFLTTGARNVRPRHQTLRAAVQWSYDLLEPAERLVLSRATVFAGGFTLEAAEAICAAGTIDRADVFDLVDSLVRKSLLTATAGACGMRYGMLETLRSFGAEQLDPAGENCLRLAHGKFYAGEADHHFALWRSPRQNEAHLWLDAELANLRAAFTWARDAGELDVAARIASSVGDMARFRLIEEAANWAEEIVARAREARHRRLQILLTWSASSAWAFGRFEDAQGFGEEAISLLGDPDFDPITWAYGDLAFVALYHGDPDRAIALLADGAAHPADVPDRFIMAFHLYIMAVTGRTTDALAIADGVVAKVDAAKVPMAMAVAHGARGIALEPVDEAAAARDYELAVEIARKSGARFMEMLIAPRLAALHARSGDPAVALTGFARMLASFGEAADIATITTWRGALIVILARLDLFNAAATLFGATQGTLDTSGDKALGEAVDRIRESLGERQFAEAADRGRAMSQREAADFATRQVQLAMTALHDAAPATA